MDMQGCCTVVPLTLCSSLSQGTMKTFTSSVSAIFLTKSSSHFYLFISKNTIIP
jgi:hypothetical protein